MIILQIFLGIFFCLLGIAELVWLYMEFKKLTILKRIQHILWATFFIVPGIFILYSLVY
jgi:hypothetical protein